MSQNKSQLIRACSILSCPKHATYVNHRRHKSMKLLVLYDCEGFGSCAMEHNLCSCHSEQLDAMKAATSHNKAFREYLEEEADASNSYALLNLKRAGDGEATWVLDMAPLGTESDVSAASWERVKEKLEMAPSLVENTLKTYKQKLAKLEALVKQREVKKEPEVEVVKQEVEEAKPPMKKWQVQQQKRRRGRPAKQQEKEKEKEKD